MHSCTNVNVHINMKLFPLFLVAMVATLQLPGISGPKLDWCLVVSMTPTLVSYDCVFVSSVVVSSVGYYLPLWHSLCIYRLPALLHPPL